jgi:hypothetical protein
MKGDFTMEKRIINEETGIQYTLVGDYYLPNLALPPQKEECSIGRFGRMRLRYLKEHRRMLYTQLLTSGTLNSHLHEAEEAALDRLEMIIRQMAAAQGVTERLKAEDQMAWVGRMNNIWACAEEIVVREVVYE